MPSSSNSPENSECSIFDFFVTSMSFRLRLRQGAGGVLEHDNRQGDGDGGKNKFGLALNQSASSKSNARRQDGKEPNTTQSLKRSCESGPEGCNVAKTNIASSGGTGYLSDFYGRSGGIRTHDPLTPSQVRYRAALRSEPESRLYISLLGRKRKIAFSQKKEQRVWMAGRGQTVVSLSAGCFRQTHDTSSFHHGWNLP